MNSKQRMLTALDGERPDRVPVTVHQWQPSHLRRILGGVTDLEAFRRFGLDASLARMPFLPQRDPAWVVREEELEPKPGYRHFQVTIRTPGGVLTYERGQGEFTSWQITHALKRQEDLELLERYLPVPRLDHAALRREYEALGEDGILRGFVCGGQGGCWQDAATWMGTQALILEAHDNPEWVHALLGVLLKRKLRFIEESLKGAPYDLIETGGGAGSSSVISPKYFKEFCLPYDRQLHEALRAVGQRVVYHTCGGMMPILELIVATGCDASETLTPPAMGGDARPGELKSRIGSQVALIGGLDQGGVLEKGGQAQIEEHVRATFEAYGEGGGYVMSPSDHFFQMSVEQLTAYAQAGRGCAY